MLFVVNIPWILDHQSLFRREILEILDPSFCFVVGSDFLFCGGILGILDPSFLSLDPGS